MALLPPNRDFTDKDFDALRVRLIALVKSVFPGWSDFEVAGFGNLLIEMYAFVGDVITFYLDNQARESRLVTATQRKNVIALARMLGYKASGAKAANAQVFFSLASIPVMDVTIPAGTVVRTKEVTEPVRFQLLADVAIPAASDPPVATGVVEASVSRTQLFDARGLADLDILLDYAPYLDGSAEVSAANGGYTEVESLLGSGPDDRHFLVLVDQNDRATLRFGNGRNGTPPVGTIHVTYKTGGGAAGNVEAGSIAVVEGAFTDAHGSPVQVSVTNPEPAFGGTERQSMAAIKVLAAEGLRTLTRTVTREDFEIGARRVPGVARALMLTRNEDPSIDENCGILFIVPEGGGEPPQALEDAVLQQVTEVHPHTLTFQVAVQAPVYRSVNVEARIYLRQGANPVEVREAVKRALQQMFQVSLPDGTPNLAIDFGFNVKDALGHPAAEVAWSDVFNTVRDTDGIRKMGDRHGDFKLNGVPADVRLGSKEFPVLGDVVLIDGDSGEIL